MTYRQKIRVNSNNNFADRAEGGSDNCQISAIMRGGKRNGKTASDFGVAGMEDHRKNR